MKKLITSSKIISCLFLFHALLLLTLPVAASASTPVPSAAVEVVSPASAGFLLPLLADGSFEGSVSKFLDFLKIILNVVAVVMVVWAGIKFHDGQTREGINALIGAFVVLLARVIVNQLAGIAG